MNNDQGQEHIKGSLYLSYLAHDQAADSEGRLALSWDESSDTVDVS